MATQGQKLKFNVGGKIIETTTTTISKASADSSLRAMLGDARFDQLGEHFIDGDPACFRALLKVLQTGQLHLCPSIPDSLLYREAHRYKLLDKLCSAKHAKLDGDNLKLTTSITSRALLNDSAALIRASSNGDCAVANGNVFHVYDWMFQELRTMNLDYMKIVGMEWYDSENILISGRKEGGGGAIGLFNLQTPELKHKYVQRDKQSSILTPGNLAIGSNSKIFCCYKAGSYKTLDSIREWDITTSQPTNFLEDSCVGDALKLQWLPTRDCLMAVISNSKGTRISLWDPRKKGTALEHFPYRMKYETIVVVDAVGIEEKECICVTNNKGRFGFVDMRKPELEWIFKEHEKWFFPLSGDKRVVEAKLLIGKPKLGWHGGKLFHCSVDGVISVYSGSGSAWPLASQLQPKHGGGLIHDFSIGGDRLFSLQAHPHDLYEINVWETPPPPLRC